MAYPNTSARTQDSKQEAQEAVRAVARRGRGMAWLSHTAAFVVLVVFSLGSLVGLTGDALTRLLTETQHGWRNAPLAIEIIVSTLLVPAMDIGMLYAATMIRLLRQRRQRGAGLHVWVIICVGAIEASTYVYMSATYDAPHTFAVWALIVARGLAAPLLATYLSLAMTPPVGSGDILYLTESLAAEGVLADMAQIAHYQSAPTDRKLAIYQAVALMAPADRARIEQVIAAERATRSETTIEPPHETAQLPPPEPSPEPPDDLPPDDTERPSHNGHDRAKQADGTTHLRFVPSVQTGSRRTAQNVKRDRSSAGARDKTSIVKRDKSRRRGSPKRLTMAAYERLWASHVEDVRRRLDSGEKVTQYRVKTDYHVSGLTASRILARAQQRVPQAQPQAV